MTDLQPPADFELDGAFLAETGATEPESRALYERHLNAWLDGARPDVPSPDDYGIGLDSALIAIHARRLA